MKTVLYTSDFEPITVVDLPLWLMDKMEKEGGARLAVPRPITVESLEDVSLNNPPYDVLTLYLEKLRWRDGYLRTIVVTPDEELALALRPEWLPGQQQAINWYTGNLRDALSHIFKYHKKS